MEPQTSSTEMNKALAERFASLPKVVQDAITSADVQQHLRQLAETQKLHLDQWQILENDVMLTLLGFQQVNDLPQHLEKDLDIDAATAKQLAENISTVVFAPIRAEMEAALSHPTAVQQAESAIESTRTAELEKAAAEAAPAAAQPSPTPSAEQKPSVAPGTPPNPAPEQKVERAQVSQGYAGAASHERKTIEGDPYREQLG